MVITLYSRPDCHLCHVVRRMAERLRTEVPYELQEVDISGDADLEARYGTRIPVVTIDQGEVLAGRITEGDLRRALERTRGGWLQSVLARLWRSGSRSVF